MKIRTLRSWVGRVVVGGWAVSLTYLIATMMVGHWVPMPRPDVGDEVRLLSSGDLPGRMIKPSDGERLIAFHFLYGDCPCSRRVLKAILTRSPEESAIELIVLIGEDPVNERKAKDLGFEVDCVTPQELKSKYNIESAPLLLVVDNRARIVYSGGYTSRKQGLDIQDTTIISRIANGEDVSCLPLYGCAVSRELKQILDPLNIKGFAAQ